MLLQHRDGCIGLRWWFERGKASEPAHGCHSQLAASTVALSFLGLFRKMDLLAKSTNPAPVEALDMMTLLYRCLVSLASVGEWLVSAPLPPPGWLRAAPEAQPLPPSSLGCKSLLPRSPGGLRKDGVSHGHEQKAMQGDVGGSVMGVQAGAAAQTPRHSLGACMGQLGHDLRWEGDCRAPALSSFQRSQVESLGSFFCFSRTCSLLELIYPCGAQSYIREGHVLPL